MGYPAGDIVKYVFGGACAADDWSVGIWQRLTGGTDVPSGAQMNAAAADRLTGFNTLVWNAGASYKTLNQAGIGLSSCKAYFYRNGVLVQQGSANIANVPGTAAFPGMPFYVASCVTLLTGTAGRSYRGRIYLPLTLSNCAAATGQFSSSLATAATNIALWVSGFGPDDSSFPGDPTSAACIVSQTKSIATAITGVRIDSLPDTQHGRISKDVATAVYSASV